jgi:tetratricopeptide (TPR) repeat protein
MKRGRISIVALVCGALMMSAGLARAQKLPQPKSPKEIEAIKAVQAAQTADDRLKAIDNVLTKFADSEFKPMLLQMAMQTAQQKNDFAQTTFYAGQILEADPKNAFAEVTLAAEIARHTREFDLDKEEKLAKAEKYANDTIANAPNQPKLRADIPDEQWNATRKDLGAQAHESLGMIANLRKKYDLAIEEYKTSLANATAPDATTYVRLGQAYIDAGKLDDASAAFDKAMSLPNASAAVKQIAQGKKNEVAKKKAAGVPSSSAAPAPEKP